jgi:hypothetical protein
MFKDIIFAGAGYIIGAFTPGVLRQVKSWLTSKSKAAVAAVPAAVVSTIKADAVKVETAVVAEIKKL